MHYSPKWPTITSVNRSSWCTRKVHKNTSLYRSSKEQDRHTCWPQYKWCGRDLCSSIYISIYIYNQLSNNIPYSYTFKNCDLLVQTKETTFYESFFSRLLQGRLNHGSLFVVPYFYLLQKKSTQIVLYWINLFCSNWHMV